MWEYKSDRVVHEEEEAPPQLPTANSIVASPQKRHVTVPNSKHFENVNSNECRICGETGEKSFWIGCSHKNKLSGRQDCNYWVHQWCIGLSQKIWWRSHIFVLHIIIHIFVLHMGKRNRKVNSKKKIFLSVCLPISFTMCLSMYILWWNILIHCTSTLYMPYYRKSTFWKLVKITTKQNLTLHLINPLSSKSG